MKRRNFLSLLGLAPAAYALPIKQEKTPVPNPAWKDAEFEEEFYLHPLIYKKTLNGPSPWMELSKGITFP